MPDDAEFTIDYAWALATTPDDARRDGAAAIRLVGKLADAPGNQQVRALDALGAGLAAQGRFSEAADAARRAISHCVDANMKSEIAERLRLYESGKSFTLPRN